MLWYGHIHGNDFNYTLYDQKTTQYPMGPHNRTVYDGNSSTTPLTVNYLIIQNGTLTSSSSLSSKATSMGSSAANPTSTTKTGLIVGGAVGGAACLLSCLLLPFVES